MPQPQITDQSKRRKAGTHKATRIPLKQPAYSLPQGDDCQLERTVRSISQNKDQTQNIMGASINQQQRNLYKIKQHVLCHCEVLNIFIWPIFGTRFCCWYYVSSLKLNYYDENKDKHLNSLTELRKQLVEQSLAQPKISVRR